MISIKCLTSLTCLFKNKINFHHKIKNQKTSFNIQRKLKKRKKKSILERKNSKHTKIMTN